MVGHSRRLTVADPPRNAGIPDPTAVARGELAKSATTRRRILDAAVRLLAEQGYQGFSTSAVASATGLTRPAMLYHFPSRLELTTATIRHLARRRIEIFEASLGNLPTDGSNSGRNARAAAVDATWNQLESPEFAAFTELTMAARTDAELRAVLEPALIVFDRARQDVVRRALPQDSWDEEDLALARDVVRFLSEGVVQQATGIENREARIAALKHFLHMLVASSEGHRFFSAVMASWQDRQKDRPDG
jgi:AcrR family transcriptional regulator